MASIFFSLGGVTIENNFYGKGTYYWLEIRIRWRCSFGRFAVWQTVFDARQLEHGDRLSHLI